MALRCGEQYRRRYIEGEKIPPAIAMLKGSGVHRGAEHNYRQKMTTREDLAVKEIVDAAVAGFEAEVGKGYILSDDERTEGDEKVRGKATDGVVSLTTLYAEKVSPTIQPVLVEEKIELEIPGADHTLLGILDVADESGWVRDLKTTGKKKMQSEADTSMQLTTYWLAYLAKMGKPPAGVALDVLVEKKVPEAQRLESHRDASDVAVLAELFKAVETMLKTGTFTPNTQGWWCSKKMCGYAAMCKFFNKREGNHAE